MNYVEWIRQVDEGTRAPTYLVRVTEPFLWDSMKEVIQKDLLGGNVLDLITRKWPLKTSPASPS